MHDPFTVSTVPIDHDFCGLLTVVAKLDGVVVDLINSDPLMYIEQSRMFIAYSNDDTLYGKILPYSLEAEFTEYPKIDNPTVSTGYTEADVSFNNPCWYPSTFSKTAQTDPDDHRYTNDDVVFTLNPFTIEPVRCQVIYECTSVVRVDGAASTIGCADFVFDGTYNNQATDGKLTFSAV